MELKDLYITPFYIILVYAIAYGVRSSVTNIYTKKYFIPALTVKLVGAIVLGILFYTIYGGDTNTYYAHAGVLYKAFGDSFAAGVELVFSNGIPTPSIQKYTDQLSWYGQGSNEYFVIRVAGVFALLTFNTYSAIAVCFAATTFTGMWAMYMTFAKIRPQVYKELATAVFFLPSVFFWGSGLMKDSLCIGALGWLFHAFYRGAIERKDILQSILMGAAAIGVIYAMKIYILLAFLPPALLWVFNESTRDIRSSTVRILVKPLFLSVGAIVAVYAMAQLGAADARFNVDNVAAQSKLTAEYLQGVSKSEQGSGYNIGEQDGTLGGMLKLAPQAIVVSLFRPFLWEARNPTMLLSALESTYFVWLTFKILRRVGIFKTISAIGRIPVLTLCFVFSLIFAISVGVSSGNFGTLVRYKIPLMPFYLAGLYILQSVTVASAAPKAAPRRAAGAGAQLARA
ncbi:hypothetical protein [Hymenobacter rubidus]|uniref:hypothetical protein n=1 Tax=Hymenobacter rubidus TaxID=1441626 RepID=UPI00191DCBB5|nr:hypothetical protein [Hymenobacter rubidus]